MSWPELLTPLVQGVDQPRGAISWAMERILAGEATPAQWAAFVVALRSKGETVEEMSALADTMLEFATPIDISTHAVDVVGSGADRANTVNISTMAAIVVAGAGATVVKHGNRAASSACGAADVLEELGLVLALTPQQQEQVVAQTGIGFLFAAQYHPALRFASAPRRELGIATTFNFLGPLANPAQPSAQAVGVADERMAELMAGVFAARGNQGLVFHGSDGLDELTTTTSSQVWVFVDGQLTALELEPLELGVPRASVTDLVGGAPPVNAQAARDLLDGKPGPVHDIVVLNAAAALTAYHEPEPDRLYDQLRAEMARAEEAIASGAARDKLAEWVTATRSFESS